MFDIDIVCLPMWDPWTKFHLGDAHPESLVERIDMYMYGTHTTHLQLACLPYLTLLIMISN